MTQIIERIVRRTGTLFGVYIPLIAFAVAASGAVGAAREASALGLAIFIPIAALSLVWLAAPLYRFIVEPVDQTLHEREGEWALSATEETVPARRRWHWPGTALRHH